MLYAVNVKEVGSSYLGTLHVEATKLDVATRKVEKTFKHVGSGVYETALGRLCSPYVVSVELLSKRDVLR